MQHNESLRLGDGGLSRPRRLLIHALWLVRLRWVAVIGQLFTIAFARFVLGVDLSLAPLLGIVLVTALTNIVFTAWLLLNRRSLNGRSPDVVSRESLATGAGARSLRWGTTALVGVMTLDLFALTALLYFAGGIENPFFVFYFVNLALAAVILPRPWGWVTAAIAVASMAFLFFSYVDVPELHEPRAGKTAWPWLGLTFYQQGLLAAFAACAGVLVYFITRLTRELRRREAEARAAEQQMARSERLESLATLAAGAGHELASPLSTIAVASKELQRHLEGVEVPVTVKEDVALIRAELDRCRGVLDHMAGAAGQAVGEPLEQITIERLVGEVITPLRRGERVRVQIEEAAAGALLTAPIRSLGQAIRNVVQNALDAAGQEGEVRLRVGRERDLVVLEVQDSGPGMPPDVLARAGEPFFTTKEPGTGMGMGLFLTRTVVTRLSGQFDLRSTLTRGTTATIRLPIDRGVDREVADWE